MVIPAKSLQVLLGLVSSATVLLAQSTDLLTWHNNRERDGLNSAETTLTQANVTKSMFGKVCSTASGAIDGQVYAQPLVVTGAIPGYNHVVYVATMNDSVYFIDGDSADCAVIKSISLLQANEEAAQCVDVGDKICLPLRPVIGILGTPVIDTTTNTMYLVTWTESTSGTCPTTKAHSCFAHKLHALDITTGAEKFKGPVAIPSVTIGASTFSSYYHIQRSGLLLLADVEANGDRAVYVAFSAMDGAGETGKTIPHGWVFGFDAVNLSRPPIAWTSTPNGQGGGIWMSGAGLAAGIDQAGGQTYIYVATGDGTFDAESGGSDYGDSMVKLTTRLTVSGYFTPYKQYCDDIQDWDLGSGGVMLIPNGVGSSTIDFALANGKDGNIYVMNRANPGGYAGPGGTLCPNPAGPNLNYETVKASEYEFYSTNAFWQGSLYSIGNHSPLRKYAIGAACHPAPVCQTASANSTNNFTYGAVPTISSNGDTTGTAIVWAINGNGWPSANSGVKPEEAVLFAYDAEHVALPDTLPELWNSKQCPTRDAPGNATKFTVPTVANGRVFIGTMDPTDAKNTRGELDVYGPTTKVCN